ncbi:hypothetical protein ACFLZ4_01785 [Patescibacteria group bacterium]
MKKGSLLPVVLIVIVFIILPVSFWYFSNSSNSNIHGAKTLDLVGVIVEIDSDGTWGLSGYLCKTLEGCLSSLDAGEKVKTSGGGKGEGREVKLEYSGKWDEYEFLKVFVKPGWGSDSDDFNIEEFGGTTSSAMHEVEDVEVGIIPLKDIRSGVFEVVKFSD